MGYALPPRSVNVHTPEKSSRRRWRKKRCWAVAALLVLPPPLYLLGGGPVLYYDTLYDCRFGFDLSDDAPEVWDVVWGYAYRPVVIKLRGTSFGDFWWEQYLSPCLDRAATKANAEFDAKMKAEFGDD